jgi:GNAT superfamily N-acetyltransferase
MRLKQLAQKLGGYVFGKYQIIRIYQKEIDKAAISPSGVLDCRKIDDLNWVYESGAEEIKTHAWYGGRGAWGYGAMQDEKIVCTVWYWTREDQRVPARFFPPLQPNEAVMVDLLTAQAARGRGYASSLISYSEQKLREAGFRRLWTWVWHSNHPSIRTFEKSGWEYTGFLVEVQPFGIGKRIQIRLRPR